MKARLGGLAASAGVAIAGLVLSVVTVMPAYATTSVGGLTLDQARQTILSETNAARSAAGLPPVRMTIRLNEVAQNWSKTMASEQKMYHNPSYSKQYPSGWSRAAENVAYGYRVASVTTAWLNSPGHRANILEKSTNYIGIGVGTARNGQLYYTQNFATYSSTPSDVIAPREATCTSVTTNPVSAPPPGDSSFTDVGKSTPFAPEIYWLVSTGITKGYDDGTFRPQTPVNRDAMAAFLYRLAGSPEFTPPRQSPFKDVAITTPFYKEISWLASMGISRGYDDHTFRPLEKVNRDAMAAFLYRFVGQPSFVPSGTSPFVDVAPSHPFYKQISWLAATGISTGSDAGEGCYRYGPLDPINRDAMAAFLYRLERAYE